MTEYTPDIETAREQYSREQPPHIGTVSEKRAEFDRFIAQVRRDAAREVGLYIEHLHPNGPTHTTAVLADIDLAADRMGRGLHANGRERETP